MSCLPEKLKGKVYFEEDQTTEATEATEEDKDI